MIDRCCNECLSGHLTSFWVLQVPPIIQIIQQETLAALLDREEEEGGIFVDVPTLKHRWS